MVSMSIDIKIACKCGTTMEKIDEQQGMLMIQCSKCYNTVYIQS